MERYMKKLLNEGRKKSKLDAAWDALSKEEQNRWSKEISNSGNRIWNARDKGVDIYGFGKNSESAIKKLRKDLESYGGFEMSFVNQDYKDELFNDAIRGVNIDKTPPHKIVDKIYMKYSDDVRNSRRMGYLSKVSNIPSV